MDWALCKTYGSGYCLNRSKGLIEMWIDHIVNKMENCLLFLHFFVQMFDDINNIILYLFQY